MNEENLDKIVKLAEASIKKEDYQNAFKLLYSYEDSQNTDALNILAFLYMNGLHVNQDSKKALMLFKKSLKLGSALAAHNLGTLYMLNLSDLPQDKEKAKEYFELAAEMGANFTNNPDFYNKL